MWRCSSSVSIQSWNGVALRCCKTMLSLKRWVVIVVSRLVELVILSFTESYWLHLPSFRISYSLLSLFRGKFSDLLDMFYLSYSLSYGVKNKRTLDAVNIPLESRSAFSLNWWRNFLEPECTEHCIAVVSVVWYSCIRSRNVYERGKYKDECE